MNGFTPAYPVGAISLVVLGLAIFARYRRQMIGPWRWLYVIGAMIALYLNVFVGVVMAFQRVPSLAAIAPTQTEPPFAITQLAMLALFVVLATVAAIRFRSEPLRAA